MTFQVIGVRAADARNPLFRPFLEQFTDNGEVPVESRLCDIEQAKRQLWLIVHNSAVKAAALTEITHDNFPVCHITHLSGDGLMEWRDAFLEIEAWARHNGCARIKALARPGYERVGKRYGLKKTHVLLEKDL